MTNLSWKMFCVHVIRMFVLLLLDGMFYICLLGPFGLKYISNPVSSLICFDDSSILDLSEVLKSPTLVTLLSILLFCSVCVCLIYLSALMLTEYIFTIVE